MKKTNVAEETKPESKEFSVGVSTSNRLLSLDLYRGFTMFLLIASPTAIYSHLTTYTDESSFLHSLALQFHHVAWDGLRFWDLVQPFFMFIVGVAMVYSINNRVKQEGDWPMVTRHIVKRCLILFFLGVLLHCIYSGMIVWELWNVLTQLSFTILVAYMLFQLPLRQQLYASFGLILLTGLLYRLFPLEGFNQPFVMGQNFGTWMDLVLMGKTNGGGWVAVNALPTAAHTIWGVMAGKILISDRIPYEKIKILVMAGIAGLVVGYGLHWLDITPIIKRISTSSFVITSGGWCLLVLAACYWLVDVKGYKRFVFFFSIVGMNSIFIYMFAETITRQWLVGFTSILTNGILMPLGAGEALLSIAASLAALAISWYLCYWLYKNKVFIKI